MQLKINLAINEKDKYFEIHLLELIDNIQQDISNKNFRAVTNKNYYYRIDEIKE